MSADDAGSLTRREIAWRLELAANKMRRRGMKLEASSPVDSVPKFTEEESKLLEETRLKRLAEIAERFRKE